MGELSAAIIGGAAGIIAAIITGVVTVIGQNRKLNETLRHLGFGENEASMKRQLENKLGTGRKSIDEQLGVEAKSISEQLGVRTKSISEQLGVGTKSISEQLGVGIDDCSLSKQHDELKRCITEKNSDIASIASTIRTIEERRNNLNATQQGLLDTLNAFMVNWQELQTRVRLLEAENTSLKADVAEPQNQLEQDFPEEFERCT